MSRERAIGPFVFSTRKDAETAIRAILHNSPINEPLVGDDRVLIEALLHCHHEAEEKIGPGVVDISVKQFDFGSRCFWVHRIDGSGIDFSYKTALDGARSKRGNVIRALRAAVDQQIKDFRQQWFADHADALGRVTCPLSGQKFTMGAHAHVDHVRPFSELAEEFIASLGGPDNIPYRQSTRHAGPELANEWHADLWRVYHALATANGGLRVVHQSANLARHRKGAA